MSKVYRCTLEVRAYDIDVYRHMNHAVYVSYFEQARWEMLAEEGITLKKFDEWKCWPIVYHVDVTYKRPALMGEKLEVHTTPLKCAGARMIFDQKIYRGSDLIAEAMITLANIDENGRPQRVHSEFARLVAKNATESTSAGTKKA